MLSGLWPHQTAALKWMAGHPRAWLQIPMGGGKTRTVLEHIERGSCRRVLVLAPARVTRVWPAQVERWLPDVVVNLLAPGVPIKERAANLYFISGLVMPFITDVVVTNYEAVLSPVLAKAVEHWDPDLIVCDESQRLKAPTGRLYRAVRKLAEHSDVILMTGTPAPHSPLDYWAQAKIIDPGVFPGPFSKYRDAVAVMGGPHRNWVQGFKVDPNDPAHYDPEVADQLTRKLAQIKFSAEVPQNIGLVSTFRIHPLPDDVRKLYETLRDEWALELDRGVVAPQNALVRLLRLAQLASGKLDLDPVGFIDHQERLDTLVEVLEDIDEPVVVGCRFRAELEMAKVAAQTLDRTYGEISGTRSDGLTADGTHAGQQVLGVQYQSGGLGIDLSYAGIAVLVGHTYSLGDYDQFIARMRRPGQARGTVRVVHLLASDTVDEDVYGALKSRRDVIEAVEASIKRVVLS